MSKRTKKKWYIDLPDPRDLGAAWITVATCDTRREAVAFCKKNGLEHGRPGVISLITGCDV